MWPLLMIARRVDAVLYALILGGAAGSVGVA
jgi:hypothetical protein